MVVYNTIKNTGIHATKSYYVNYYIKKKNSKQKKYIGKYHYSGLGSGNTRYKKITIKLSKSIKASNYYVAAYVDTHKTVSESNETNNYKTGPIKSA